ncbi:hypothetical protein Rt10032_c03g1392 [Rhodotorula toruloides]|uniref:Uncharacterized protein n=1 Tax=Rhodotorula toruloides TaxID=5286 RepID=A0A511KBN1_RHOTO|nr:hypothetical protein Rt10032_c03g1392 [Rhodotorula toruloides]
MGKATSFADLRLAKDKLLKRFQRGGSAAGRDLDFFGCAGEMDFEEGDEAWQGECTKATLHGPPSTAPPPRRPAPYRFPLSAPLSSEEQRQLERRREEELAAAACLDYISAQSHSTRSSSLADIDTTGVTGLSNAVERTNIQQHPLRPSHPHARVPSRDMLDLDAEGRPRSNSVVSLPLSASDCSSRPRTNDSLPSFAESASTIDTTGSFPPSPVQSPSLRSRPTFASGIAPVKVDTEVIAQQPRAYTFI